MSDRKNRSPAVMPKVDGVTLLEAGYGNPPPTRV